MKLQFEDKISGIADKARDRYQDAISAARSRTDKAAGRVTKGKKPVKTVSRLGVKLSGVSHRTANKLWKRQTRLVVDQIDTLAGRLKAAAAAPDLKGLVKAQIEIIPASASRLKVEARETFEIVKGAGSEIRDIVKESVDELRGRKPVATNAPGVNKAAAAMPPAVDDEIAA